MKRTTRKNLFLLLALVVSLVLLPSAAISAQAEETDPQPNGLSRLYYIREDGVEDYVVGWYCIEQSDGWNPDFTINDKPFTSWYGAEGDVTIHYRLKVEGNVKLVLKDGATLTVEGGIELTEGNSLTIYGQKDGTGKLIAEGTFDEYNLIFNTSGIGGTNNVKNGSCGILTINGGNITATGGRSCAGIGCDNNKGVDGTITINGGTVTASGGENEAGIYGKTITINGGTVVASGGEEGIGGRFFETNGTVVAVNITINGGTVTATGGSDRSGIGGFANVKINGGTVTARGGSGAGIGGNGSSVTITNGTVTAEGGENGAGIGSDSDEIGAEVTVTINGGTVTARGGKNGAGIGGGIRGNGGNVSINGGTVTAIAPRYGQAIGSGLDGTNSGTLTLPDGYCVYPSETASNPVAYADREFACHNKRASNEPRAVRITPCTSHGASKNGICPYCGAEHAPILYVGSDGTEWNCNNYTLLTDQTTLKDYQTYVVNGSVQIDRRIDAGFSSTIILMNGAKLTASKGFHVKNGALLSIYAQSLDSKTAGKLTVSSPDDGNAGIGGNAEENCGSVYIYSGVLEITGGYRAAAIGGGRSGSGGIITISGGFITANGVSYGTGIGGGSALNASYTAGSSGLVFISGGEIVATGGDFCPGIGNGCGSNPNNGFSGDDNNNFVMIGGTVRATGGKGAAGIGGGYYSNGCKLMILGGEITAAGSNSKAIGGGTQSADDGLVSFENLSGESFEIKVTAGNSENTAVTAPAANRIDACRSRWAKIEPCFPHENGSDGYCPYCGADIEPDIISPNEAIFTATGADTGTLSNVTDGMKYKIDDGEWQTITGTIVELTSLKPCTITVYNPGDGTTTEDSDEQIITVTKAATPALDAYRPATDKGKGVILTTPECEKSTNGTDWEDCGVLWTDLDVGTYYVRVKAKGTSLASDAQEIVIAVEKEEPIVTPKTGDNSNYGLFTALIIISICGAATLFTCKKNRIFGK